MKTIEEIKNEVAIEYYYESYDDFKNLTRKIDTDIIFVMDVFFNKVAKRYAKEVAIEIGRASCRERVSSPV